MVADSLNAGGRGYHPRMTINDPAQLHLWHLLTRLGEAQILLPAAALTVLALLRRPEGRRLAAWWMALMAAAVLVTTATKVAFIGWGIGWPAIDFTGISGHAMFAAAVYPLLLGTLASNASHTGRRLGLAVGCTLALLVGLSRVLVGAHSVSEALAGLLVGGAASAGALAMAGLAPTVIGATIPIMLALWFALMPVHSPASTTHSAVTRLSLMISGHTAPFIRREMHKSLR